MYNKIQPIRMYQKKVTQQKLQYGRYGRCAGLEFIFFCSIYYDVQLNDKYDYQLLYNSLAQCAYQLMEAGRAGERGMLGWEYILYVRQWSLFPLFTLQASLKTLFK
jgi:hypothetical protein